MLATPLDGFHALFDAEQTPIDRIEASTVILQQLSMLVKRASMLFEHAAMPVEYATMLFERAAMLIERSVDFVEAHRNGISKIEQRLHDIACGGVFSHAATLPRPR